MWGEDMGLAVKQLAEAVAEDFAFPGALGVVQNSLEGVVHCGLGAVAVELVVDGLVQGAK